MRGAAVWSRDTFFSIQSSPPRLIDCHESSLARGWRRSRKAIEYSEYCGIERWKNSGMLSDRLPPRLWVPSKILDTFATSVRDSSSTGVSHQRDLKKCST